MHRIAIGLAAAAALGASVVAVPTDARADGGRITAGVLGGLAVGTLFGAAVAQPRYYAPAPYYAAAPVYGPAPGYYYGPQCYWTRGAPVWDGYRGIWVRPRVQVCD